MSKRNDVVFHAQSMVGMVWGSQEYYQMLKEYNAIDPLPQGYRMKESDAWCAAFVSVCAARANALDLIPAECSCPRMINYFSAMGRWIESDDYAPKPGDIIFYDWDDSGNGDNLGTADHVGIIEDSNGESFTVIEGNISSSVGRRFLPVNAQYIRGFGVPAYGDGETTDYETPSVEEPVEENRDEVSQVADNLYTIRSGDSWWRIASEQLGDGTLWEQLMKLNGYTEDQIIYAGQVIKLWDDDCASCKIEDDRSEEQKMRDYLESQVNKLGGTVIWNI